MKILQENLRTRPLKIDDFGATRSSRPAWTAGIRFVSNMMNFALKMMDFVLKLMDFGRLPGKKSSVLHFEPALTTAEREFVHQLAAHHGLSSKSEGTVHQGADWHIVVRR